MKVKNEMVLDPFLSLSARPPTGKNKKKGKKEKKKEKKKKEKRSVPELSFLGGVCEGVEG